MNYLLLTIYGLLLTIFVFQFSAFSCRFYRLIERLHNATYRSIKLYSPPAKRANYARLQAVVLLDSADHFFHNGCEFRLGLIGRGDDLFHHRWFQSFRET